MDAHEADRLLNEAEARIDTAAAQLLLAVKGVSDANASQVTALAELTATRQAIKALRARLQTP